MIHFYSCIDLKETEAFYKAFPLTVFMRQEKTIIYDSKEGMIGFIEMEHVAPSYSCISFVVEDYDAVDAYYEKFKDIAISKPAFHKHAPVYSFFIKDPNGYKLEFQCFV